MKKNMKHVHMIISGDVQGVGLRSWTKREALKLDISGWVKNRQDGTVEIVAEGSRESLEKFIELCKHGSEISWVEDVQVIWSEATGEFLAFQVVY